MAGFQDLTKLLQDDTHRIVVVRDDGTPIGVLVSFETYTALVQPGIAPRKSLIDDPLGEAPTADTVHAEWDALMEKVGDAHTEKDEETYLFEPVE